MYAVSEADVTLVVDQLASMTQHEHEHELCPALIVVHAHSTIHG